MSVDLDKLFSEISKLKVAVIGDVMLDTYWWGTVDRISPEGPVPVVAVTKKEHRIGGAGNVALNVQALGAKVALITLLGKDEEGQKLNSLLKENKMPKTGIIKELINNPAEFSFPTVESVWIVNFFSLLLIRYTSSWSFG